MKKSNDRIIVFGWTIPLNNPKWSNYMQLPCFQEGCIKYEKVHNLFIDTSLRIVRSENKYELLWNRQSMVFLSGCAEELLFVMTCARLGHGQPLRIALVMYSQYISFPCSHLHQGQFPDSSLTSVEREWEKERAQREYERNYNEHSTWVNSFAFSMYFCNIKSLNKQSTQSHTLILLRIYLIKNISVPVLFKDNKFSFVL